MSTDPKDDELSRKLRAWQVEPIIPAGFNREVWQRISTRQAARADALWPSLAQWLSVRLARPQYAVALCAVMLTSGIGLARVQAQQANAKTWQTLGARYAISVDPLALAR
jgi:anti-sigma-K factor RskA